MTDFEKILNSGKLYRVQDGSDSDPRYQEYLQQMETYNQLGYTKAAEQKKQQILKQLFAEVGDKAYIQAPYYAMWGGHHVHCADGNTEARRVSNWPRSPDLGQGCDQN